MLEVRRGAPRLRRLHGTAGRHEQGGDGQATVSFRVVVFGLLVRVDRSVCIYLHVNDNDAPQFELDSFHVIWI